jgi:ABC-type bacteriocin/lantibiotic exporter with double-glycine peptidase domain
MYCKFITQIYYHSRQYYKEQISILIFWIFITGLTALIPFLNRGLIDTLLSKHIGNRILLLVLGILCLKTFAIILNFVSEYKLETLKRKVTCDLWLTMYQSLQNLPIMHIYKDTSASYITKILSDGEIAAHMIAGFLPSVFLNIIRIAAVSVVLIILNPLLALISFCSIPLYYLTFTKYSQNILQSSQNERKRYSILLESLKEKIEGLPFIVFYNKEGFYKDKFLSDTNDWLKWIKKLILNIQKYNTSYFYFTSIFPLLIFGIGALLIIHSGITIGGLIAFFLYVGNLYEPLSNLATNFGSLSKTIPSFERVSSILNSPHQARKGDKILKELKELTMKNVTFGYKDTVVLDRLNFSLKFGRNFAIAVVGKSGCGKSTFARIMSGFFDSEQCEINGFPIICYDKISLRRYITLVGQNDFLFNLTVAENLSMGDQFTKEEMLQALVNCGMNLDVKFLESHIGERGLRLSDGQKQRVSLARAILRKPQLLVLDEALSGVDAETESLIFNKIKRLIPYIIVISHRLSTILQCSGIYVLHDGRFVDSGSHEELLNSCTLYRELIKEQIIEKSTTGSSNEK